jgi:hypothetical protein
MTESQVLPGLVPNGDSASLDDVSSRRDLVWTLVDCQPGPCSCGGGRRAKGIHRVLCFARREFFGSMRSSLAR